MKRIQLVCLCLLPFLSGAASREVAMKPHLGRLWSRWNDLPTKYQHQKRHTLEEYLALFTTTNGAAWNEAWADFTAKMGPEFSPLYADVIEAMKVAEAYEAGFPSPDDKLPRIADAIFERAPTNALLFIQSDLFETILRVRQQGGTRIDVLVLNSSRLMDESYLSIALAGQRTALKLSTTELAKRVFDQALQKKQNGEAEFRDLELAGGKVRADGIQLITSLNGLMMREISDAAPGRVTLLLPSLQGGGSGAGWAASTNIAMLFEPASNSSREDNLLSGWQALLDQAAPLGLSVHAEMQKTVDQSIRAVAASLTERGQKQVSGKLRSLWAERLKGITVVDSRDIQINAKGQMVQGGAANAAPPHR